MKKLTLMLITIIFSSLLIACGMRGPLYQEQEPQHETKASEKTESAH